MHRAAAAAARVSAAGGQQQHQTTFIPHPQASGDDQCAHLLCSRQTIFKMPPFPGAHTRRSVSNV